VEFKKKKLHLFQLDCHSFYNAKGSEKDKLNGSKQPFSS